MGNKNISKSIRNFPSPSLSLLNKTIKYKYADLREAQKFYLSNSNYLNRLNIYDLEYRVNKKNVT